MSTNDNPDAGPEPQRQHPDSGAVLPSTYPATQPILELSEVVVRRQKGGGSFVLRVPELRVQPGEFVAIVGPSGCGKSTLLDVLGLILIPTEAQHFAFRDAGGNLVVVDARTSDSKLAAMRRTQLGYVLQTGGLLPFLSVQKNIELPRRINGMKDDAEAARQLAASLGIESQLSKLPKHLSCGQRQRAAIARALAHLPPVILADEPTASVDRYNALEILGHFKSLVERMGMALMMVTHDIELVRESADRFLTFDLQRISDKHVQSTCHEVERSHI